MTQKEGLEYAKERHLIDTHQHDFYKLFKTIARIKDITANEKIVLSVILSYTERGMEFHMSNNTLSYETGIDDSTVSRIITKLKEGGWIKTYKIKDKKNTIIGRVIIPQKHFIEIQVEKFYDNYIYDEY